MARASREASYHFAIVRRTISYSFGSGTKFHDDAYSEYLHPQFTAKCLWPAERAGNDVEFTFVAHRHVSKALNEGSDRRNDAPVGDLTMRGKANTFLGSLPFDTATHIQTMLALDALPYISLVGEPLYRGRADIRWVHFDTERPEDI